MNATALETLRGWISTGTLLAMLGFIARLWVTNRKLGIENRKLGMQEKVEDRQGFGALIEALSREVASLREENTALRHEVRELHGLIDGMRRGDMQARASAQVLELRAKSPDTLPPATAAALDRIEGNG